MKTPQDIIRDLTKILGYTAHIPDAHERIAYQVTDAEYAALEGYMANMQRSAAQRNPFVSITEMYVLGIKIIKFRY